MRYCARLPSSAEVQRHLLARICCDGRRRSDAARSDRTRRRSRPRRRLRGSRLSLPAQRSGEPHVGELGRAATNSWNSCSGASPTSTAKISCRARCTASISQEVLLAAQLSAVALSVSMLCTARSRTSGASNGICRCKSSCATVASFTADDVVLALGQSEARFARGRRASRRPSRIRRRSVVERAAVHARPDRAADRHRPDGGRRHQRRVRRSAAHADSACTVAARAGAAAADSLSTRRVQGRRQCAAARRIDVAARTDESRCACWRREAEELRRRLARSDHVRAQHGADDLAALAGARSHPVPASLARACGICIAIACRRS